jgi:hypothetical protein
MAAFAKSRARWIALAATLIAALIGAAVVVFQPNTVPAGQRAFLSVSASNAGELKDAFNRGVGHPRLIAFLSPT